MAIEFEIDDAEGIEDEKTEEFDEESDDDLEEDEEIDEENEEDEEESGEEEEMDVDVLEFSLNKHDIDELIEKLIRLRETQESAEFEIDDYNELLIHYEDEEENDDLEDTEDEYG